MDSGNSSDNVLKFLLQADPGIRVLFLGTLFATKCVAWSGLVLAAAAARPRYLPFLYGGAGGRVLTRFEHHFPKATLRIQALSARAASSRSAQLLARATGADPADLAPAAAEVTVAFRFVWPLWFPVQCWLLMSLLPGPWMMNSHGHHSKRDAESIEDIPAESIEDIP
ncbi:Uncharacterized protein SCF082_LOCUS37738 [Durusdinium trenchii]|uniref:Uncharacterized protein n=1 Tax=Durusdinium trenchii TaxID=1381693 RepID=A0ABP0PUK7_9DINO